MTGMIVIIALTAAWALCQLTRLPAPKMAGAKGKMRLTPGSVSLTVMIVMAALALLAFAGALTHGTGWQAGLLVWSGAAMFLVFGQTLAVDGVRWGEAGFAYRDALGRARFARWAEVLAAEQTIIRRRRGFDQKVTAVYLPGRTLLVRETLEGTERPFLGMLREKRADLPSVRPEGARLFPRWPELAISAAALTALLALALMGTAVGTAYAWLWALPGLWAAYLVKRLAKGGG